MPTVVHVILRVLAPAAVIAALAISPQLAQAQAPGSLAQIGSAATAASLSAIQDVAVSPDGNNVYAIAVNGDGIQEFTRGADGLLTQIGCIADQRDRGETSCSSIATGIAAPQAIAISPDGKNVYVAAEDDLGIGDVAEFAVNSGGSLTQLGSGHACIAENTGQTDGQTSDCSDQSGHGMAFPDALVVSPNGQNVYVGDHAGQAVGALARASDGSLSQPGASADCIDDTFRDTGDCTTLGSGLSDVTGVAISPDGADVYTSGAPGTSNDGSVAAFSVGPGGVLSQIGCAGTPEDSEECGNAIGIVGITGLVVSPDGKNVYTASQFEGGPIAEFSRNATTGELTQLPSPNDCIEEQSADVYSFTCGSTGIGIGSGYRLAISPDGANVYAPAPGNACVGNGTCSDVAEFARDGATGALTQLAAPDSCIQDSSAGGSECPGNENGSGLGGPGVAISPDGNNVYTTGTADVAEFGRGTHTLTVSVGGTGTGAVTDGTGAIDCRANCSHAYPPNTPVTLSATADPGSAFSGWGGACSGTGTCQLRMSADESVTATFTANATPPPAPPTPGAPTPVLTGAPTAVTDSGAGFTGSVNPDGLATTVYFQYGLDKRYSQLGASGANYTEQTPGQLIGSDFSPHGVGPIAVSGLIPNALYHVRLVATNSAGTVFGQDVTFMTALAPAPGTPTIGQTFNLAPVSGLVFVLIHGHLVPLTQVEQISPGTVIDSRLGTFLLTSSLGLGAAAHDAAAHGKAKTQSGQFGGAVVRIHQTRGGKSAGLTTVMMIESAFKGAPAQSICNATHSAANAQAAAINSRVIQLLHAKAHGKFATSGRYSAATVRGTVWTIIARCDGTLVRDIKDEVVVTDFVRHRTIVLHAGQSYLAPGRRRR